MFDPNNVPAYTLKLHIWVGSRSDLVDYLHQRDQRKGEEHQWSIYPIVGDQFIFHEKPHTGKVLRGMRPILTGDVTTVDTRRLRLVTLVSQLSVLRKSCKPPVSDETVNPNAADKGARGTSTK